jgi:multicomponent Na+:H+ antiporter subunit D
MLAVSPIAFGFAVAILCHALRDRPFAQRAASLLGALGQFTIAAVLLHHAMKTGPVVAQMSGWAAPFGITIAVDTLGALMLLASATCGTAAVLFGFSEITAAAERRGHHSFLHMLLAGVGGAFATGDLFNLYVWYEVLLISSFGLLVVQGGRRQLDGGMRYVALNLVATVAFLTGVGLLYGAAGTLNMVDLRGAVAGLPAPQLMVTAALLLFGFGAKAAMFPVFAWLPASYHTPSFTTSALFAALLTKVGVYSLIRVFTLIYPPDTPYLADLLVWGGALTMLAGVLGAIAQTELRRVLAFQVVASIGFMVAGLGVGTEAAIAGAIFYMLQDMVAKVGLFAVAWIVARRGGTEDLRLAGGLWAAAPWTGALFLIPALSLAGVPPFAGFWGKVMVVGAALDAQAWWLAGVALATGLLTLYSMGVVWSEMFWKARVAGAPAVPAPPPPARFALLTTLALAATITALGVAPAALIEASQQAAAELVSPQALGRAVMGADWSDPR